MPSVSANSFCDAVAPTSIARYVVERLFQFGVAHGFKRQLHELQHPVADGLARQLECRLLASLGSVGRVRVAPVHCDGLTFTTEEDRALLGGCTVADRDDRAERNAAGLSELILALRPKPAGIEAGVAQSFKRIGIDATAGRTSGAEGADILAELLGPVVEHALAEDTARTVVRAKNENVSSHESQALPMFLSFLRMVRPSSLCVVAMVAP